ncbi:hypothetical protein [Parasphingopyxis sp.]|uniref:hypothetical protein n=1 Tax=Parasphingopyxis sp. TaxID=1920299 RepID=UPI003FA09E15
MGWLARTYPEDDRPKYIAQTLQAAITVIALIAAGSWYFFDRRTEPHAILDLEVTGVRLDDNHALIEAKIIVENAGHTLLELERWDVRLLGVIPNSLCLADIATLPRDDWPRTIWIPWIAMPPELLVTDEPGEDCRRSAPMPRAWSETPGLYRGTRGFTSHNELRFATLRRFEGQAAHEIEPGEQDMRIFDFVVPCGLEVARISATVEKTRSRWLRWIRRDDREWWWKNRALVSLETICAGEPGTLAVLYGGGG